MHLSRRRISEIASLVFRKYRLRHGQYLIEGVRSVEAAVSAGVDLVEIVVTEVLAEDERVLQILNATAAPWYTVSPDVYERLSDVQTAQGILAVATFGSAAPDEVFAHQRILALDGLQDPGNVGTIIRTAAWFGVRAVIAGKGTADVYAPKTVRAAMGGLSGCTVYQSDDLAETLQEARRLGFVVSGADAAGTPVDEWKPSERTVVVVGNEGAGLSPTVSAQLEERIAIARTGPDEAVESLNVAMATGIILFEWARR